MIFRILSGSVVALGLGLFAEQADAGQTFLCNDGRILEVAIEDLGRMKREEPCVAQHYGEAVVVPLPVQRPSQVQLRKAEGAGGISRRHGKVGDLAKAHSDYRNVRIINAGQGRERWFVHQR